MLDLGASVSVMPLSIFNSLSLRPLESTNVVIHLANRSVAYPVGFIEDVLVRVGELIFLVDFYVLNMCHTLISSGDLCLMTCNFCLVLVRCLVPIIRQFVKFQDMPKNQKILMHNS